jgi:hypothetical protein
MSTNRRNNQKGSAALEFGLSFTALWFVFMGTFQFGYTFWLYNGAAVQIAEAARYASRADYDTRNNDYVNAVKNMAVYGTPVVTDATPRAVPGLTTSNVQVVFDPVAGVPDNVTVQIGTWTVNSVFRQFTFSGKPGVTVKYVGQYQTNP